MFSHKPLFADPSDPKVLRSFPPPNQSNPAELNPKIFQINFRAHHIPSIVFKHKYLDFLPVLEVSKDIQNQTYCLIVISFYLKKTKSLVYLSCPLSIIYFFLYCLSTCVCRELIGGAGEWTHIV